MPKHTVYPFIQSFSGVELRCFDFYVKNSCEGMEKVWPNLCKMPSYYEYGCKLYCKACKPDESGAELNSKCGISKVLADKTQFHRVRRVVHGNDAKEGSYPWLASLNHDGRSFCGGALIDRQWVSVFDE